MAKNPDEYDAFGGAAKGASAGAVAGPWGAVIGGLAGAATPFLTKALGGLFGVDDAENAEKASLSSLRRVADGGTTQGQAGMAYARGRTVQDLQGLANRGTAQQRAGLQRQAMQQAPGVQAQYASQLADLRSREQEHAASQVAFIEGRRAAAEAARKRAALSGAMESAVGMGTKLGMAAGSPGPKKPLETLDIGDQPSGADVLDSWKKANAAYDPDAADPYAGMTKATGTGAENYGKAFIDTTTPISNDEMIASQMRGGPADPGYAVPKAPPARDDSLMFAQMRDPFPNTAQPPKSFSPTKPSYQQHRGEVDNLSEYKPQNIGEADSWPEYKKLPKLRRSNPIGGMGL